MTSEDAREYLFHEVSAGVFVRKCYGLEEMSSNMEEHCDGFTHLTTSASVSLPTISSWETLQKHVSAAWVALRRLTPAVACKTFRMSDGDKRYALRYTVPRSKDDVQTWIGETVFFSNPDKSRSLYEINCELKNGHWWRSSDDHYVAELHVSPLGSEWAFSLMFSHNSTDGRNSFALLDLFLGFLKEDLQNKDKGNTILDEEWGSETARLPPPASFTMALAESGNPPDISAPKTQPKPDGDTNHPPMVPWLFAPRSTSATGDVSRLIQLSEDTTAKLHSLCKAHGRTITQVVTALSALAHTEAALKNACNVSEHRFKEVASALSASTHYLIAWNFINHRHKLPGGYDSYKSPTSAPLCTADGVPLFLSIEAIRNSFQVDQEKNVVQRIVNKEAFWDGLVRDVADAWKNTGQSLEAYATRELLIHHDFDSFNPAMFDVPALIVSSIGDLGRLDLLSDFHPERKSALVVNDVVCSLRFRTPPIFNLLWQYRGRISFYFMSGGEYTTAEELAVVTQLFEDWTSVLVQ